MALEPPCLTPFFWQLKPPFDALPLGVSFPGSVANAASFSEGLILRVLWHLLCQVVCRLTVECCRLTSQSALMTSSPMPRSPADAGPDVHGDG